MLLDITKHHIPNRLVKIRPFSKPFYNGYLRRIKRKLNKLHTKAKNSNSTDMWAKFRHERNFYVNEVTRIKHAYDQTKYDNLNKEINNKSFYKLSKELLGQNNSSVIPSLVTNDGNLLNDDFQKASAFNNFFAEASSLDDSLASLPLDASTLDGISTLDNIIVTEQEVKDQLQILNTKKSYGHDGLSPMFLKNSGDSLVQPITKLLNLSMSTCLFPSTWKKANVLPLYKKGDKNQLNNYRPVSLLCILSKILERIVFKHVFNHFRGNFLISIWQSGFLPGSSTVTQLIEMHYQFCNAVSEGKEIRIVFLDISKAFDRVWHQGLLFKLKKMGHWWFALKVV